MAIKLVEHRGVKDLTVVGLEHSEREERPFALVSVAAGASVYRAELDDLLGEKFADWQRPDEVEFADEMPKTTVGKNDKAAIQDEYAGRYTS
jgi:fatty-acyl-CoA synthase